MTEKMTYAGVGVDYNANDPFKLMAQKVAMTTAGNIERLGFRVLMESYGESAFVIEPTDKVPYLSAQVEEGLGTKNLAADAMHRLTGKSYYDHIAQDTVAMIVNDLVTLGALPLSVAMHLAVGDSSWFDDKNRAHDLVNGWKRACDLARCAWGGGETPTLKGLGMVVLSGSAIGVIKPKERLIKGHIENGDSIVIVESSGIHANGLTMARKVADRKDALWQRLAHLLMPEYFPSRALPRGYLTRLEDGRTYGETLLDPTHIYVGLVEDCLNTGVDIHYAVNVTGHGWRKLMRAPRSFTYVIDRLPRQLPIFDSLQRHGPMDDREAYGNLNMGAGFVLYVSGLQAAQVIHVAKDLGLKAFVAGYVESGERKVVIRPKGLEYSGATLGVR